MSKEMMIYDKVCEFMNEHAIGAVEDVFQRDSVNVDCADLVAELVRIMMEVEE